MQTKILESQKVSFMHEVLQHDLPLFLLVEIRDCLDMLNEFKIKNLFLNKDFCNTTLASLQEEYHAMIMEQHQDDLVLPCITPESSGLLTQTMLDNHLYPNFSHHEIITIKALFCVKCLFAMKECINSKQKSSASSGGLLKRISKNDVVSTQGY